MICFSYSFIFFAFCSSSRIFFLRLTSVAIMVRLWSSLLVLCLRLAAANMPNDDAAKLVRAFSRELREFMLCGTNLINFEGVNLGQKHWRLLSIPIPEKCLEIFKLVILCKL